MTTIQQQYEKDLREMLQKQASILGMNLDYKPEVIMENINEAPLSAWHESRRLGWGGSDEGVLNGLSKYSSLTQLALSKTLGISEPVDTEKQHIFDFGHANEWIALKAYANLNGYKYLTYKKYFVVCKSDKDIKKDYPELSVSGVDGLSIIYTKSFDNVEEAQKLCDVLKDYNAYIEVEESNEPKDIRDITDEEHKLFDTQGIVCVDRRQYRHPLYPSMFGDCDGLAITPSGEKIGLECKTYSHQKQGSFTSGVFGDEGVKLKNPEYALQVAHYMAVLNINRFDIIAMCGNMTSDINIITVFRDLQLEKELCDNCEKTWRQIQQDKFPKEQKLTNEIFNKLLNTISQIKVKEKTEAYISDEDNLIEEIESLQSQSLSKTREKDMIEMQINEKKLELLKKLKKDDGTYLENALVHKDDGWREVYLGSQKMTKFDDKKLKLQCPQVYSEYQKSKSFNAYISKQLPEVRKEYEKCIETQPSLKIRRVAKS